MGGVTSSTSGDNSAVDFSGGSRTVSGPDTGASVTGFGSATQINAMSQTDFSDKLHNASNADLSSIAGNSGVADGKRAAALATLLDRLTGDKSGTKAEQSANAAPTDDGSGDELNDPKEQLKKLLKKLVKGEKLSADEQKQLVAALSAMNGAQDSTAGGSGPGVATGNTMG